MKACIKATGEIISLDEKSTVLDATPTILIATKYLS